jgi:hypothetical protein
MTKLDDINLNRSVLNQERGVNENCEAKVLFSTHIWQVLFNPYSEGSDLFWDDFLLPKSPVGWLSKIPLISV